MNIYITFDYELFLSSNTGSIDNCLIKPTEKIIEICNRYNAKTTFFVDTTYLCKAREYKELEIDVIRICNQLTILSKEGHSIQLHIHPQWFYSTYSNSEGWSMDYNHYKLSDCPLEDVHKMFDDGIALLENITNKKCNAYRAGGYSIQTFLNYANFLYEKGIVIDSSCLCGNVTKSKFQEYNYKSINNSGIYKFSNKIENPDVNGCIFELPITTIKINSIKYLLLKKCKCKKKVFFYGDGKSANSKISLVQKIIKKIKLLISSFYISASIDRHSGFMLGQIYNHLKKIKSKDMTIIIHPKGTTNYSLEYFDEFLSIATKEDCCFKTTDNIR